MNKECTIDIIILGFGRVGQVLAKQILDSRDRLRKSGLAFVITGLADSKGFLYQDSGFTQTQIDTIISEKQQNQSLINLQTAQPLNDIEPILSENTLLVDTSASASTSALLDLAVEINAGIVLANKLPLCRFWEYSKSLFSYPRLRYGTTVGAGLPVISSLKSLLETGDQIESMVGCLSGTLGFLCSKLEAGVPYSQAIFDAYELGYTEPDPRQDLGGMDVARKAAILARTVGIPAELDEITVQPLYFHDLDSLSVDQFLEKSEQYNDTYAISVQKAAVDGKIPRYTARIAPAGISIGLEFVEKSSALGSLQGADNYIALHSQRYSPSPLVISGPGAGLEVTAAGVFSDIIDLGKQMIGDRTR